jgi:hypothetical protein
MPMLPFKTPPRPADTVDVGDTITGILEMPRYGSLTVLEDIAYVNALAEAPDVDGRQLMAHVRPKLAAIALRRIMPELTDEDMQQPPLNSARLQELLTGYLMDEKNGNVPAEPPDPKATALAGPTNAIARKKSTAVSTPDLVDGGPTDTTGIASAAA